MNNANCERLVDYLNAMLSEEEEKEFEAHLAGCEDCREIVEVTGELPYLAEAVEPPVEMKARILANVFEEEEKPAAAPSPKSLPMAAPKKAPKRNWLTPLLAAILLLSLLGNLYALMQNSGQQEVAEEAVLRSVALQPSEEFGGNATAAIVNEEETLNVVVQAGELEELTGTEVYQVWLLKDGQPIPTGAFTPNGSGEGAAVYKLNGSIEDWDTIAITKEPQGGNETPAGEIVLSSEI
ncbi:anti-sigma factor domain-containing protein [Planomicrobium sp. YIM 101495]|uniref:anti-sigma factor n=1 Tax=Planomicrobium sp. YIM 101495 TaxID=2665160 RepID=UPI0012B9C281|nr:anti-sigma factor [Planomicrobium sp. YIM 101495]MTD31374.1 hypothetical protein [Planomicrobium sp. YIM 101495]